MKILSGGEINARARRVIDMVMARRCQRCGATYGDAERHICGRKDNIFCEGVPNTMLTGKFEKTEEEMKKDLKMSDTITDNAIRLKVDAKSFEEGKKEIKEMIKVAKQCYAESNDEKGLKEVEQWEKMEKSGISEGCFAVSLVFEGIEP